MESLSIQAEEGASLLTLSSSAGVSHQEVPPRRRRRSNGCGGGGLMMGMACGSLFPIAVIGLLWLYTYGLLFHALAMIFLLVLCNLATGNPGRPSEGSDSRVKCVDFHPSEPLILGAFYGGHVAVWGFPSGDLQTVFHVSELPVRCAKFVPKKNKQWLVTASDDMRTRIFDYQTKQKIADFEAHTDYIRHLEIHPTLPCILTASDDMYIKLWDMEHNFSCVQAFDEHSHYVMQVKVCPRDPNIFASASLDRTIRLWRIDSFNNDKSYATLQDGHERGINSLDFCPHGEEPHLVSGGDDRRVVLWDYEAMAILHSIEGQHTHNVTSVLFHPIFKLIVSTSEDGTCLVWNPAKASSTRRLFPLNGNNNNGATMDRCWASAFAPDGSKLALCFDTGLMCLDVKQQHHHQAENSSTTCPGLILQDNFILCGPDRPLH